MMMALLAAGTDQACNACVSSMGAADVLLPPIRPVTLLLQSIEG